MSMTARLLIAIFASTATMLPVGASEALTIAADGKQPRVTAIGDQVVVTYGVGEAVMVAVSSDAGKSFAAPLHVGDVPRLSVGMRRGPQIAMTGRSVVVAAIGAAAGDLVSWRSRDSGRTWASPVTINDQAKSAAEGLFSLAGGKDDTVWAVWLDQRRQVSTIEASHSVDGGAAWTANTVFYQAPNGGVCECCQPQVAADASGAVAVMWRNQLAGSRDMWLSTSDNGGTSFASPAKLGSGTWKLNACPMDGGGVAIAGKVIHTIWRRENTLFTVAPPNRQETTIGEGRNGTVLIAGKVVYRAWQRGEVILLAIGDQRPQEVGRGGFPHLGGGTTARLQ